MKDEIHASVAAAAVAATKQQKGRIAAMATRLSPPQPGDLLSSPIPLPEIVGWVVLHPHPDDETRHYLVPADAGPWVGIGDIRLPKHSLSGPLVLRGGLGLWAYPSAFPPGSRISAVEPRYVNRVRQVLADVVRGRLVAAAAQMEHEADADFEQWRDQLMACVARMQAWIEEQGQVVAVTEFAQEISSAITRQTAARIGAAAESPLAAAASSQGLLGKLVKVLSDTAPRDWLTWKTSAGPIYLHQSPDGITGIWTEDGPPPKLRGQQVGGKWAALRWKTEADYKLCGPIPWRNGTIDLRLENGEHLKVKA